MQNAGLVFAAIAAVGLACASPSDASVTPSAFRMIKDANPHLIVVSHRGYYDDDADDEEDRDDPPPPPEARGYPQPPEGDVVPEWVPPPRPANCGEYKYWNGAYCADAREQPPYVGPRW